MEAPYALQQHWQALRRQKLPGLQQAFHWPSRAVEAVRGLIRPSELQDSLLFQARTFSSHCSGWGTAEYCLEIITNAIQNQTGQLIPLHPVSACEWALTA